MNEADWIAGDGDLRRVNEARRSGKSYLAIRLPDSGLQLHILDPADAPIEIGRSAGRHIQILGDERVSRLHAELIPSGSLWTLRDDGLSTNGTLVNGDRVLTRRRLRDLDRIVVGRTEMMFRATHDDDAPSTALGDDHPGDRPRLSDAKLRVLTELCRPYASSAHGPPPRNDVIAKRLFISESSVKRHLREMFRALEITGVQNEKRALLAKFAIEHGLVDLRALEREGTGGPG